MNSTNFPGAVEIFQIDGFRIEVPVEALSPPLRERLQSGQFEVSERALLTRFIRPGDRLLDLGAGSGLVSLTAARILGPQAVTAVEANPQMHQALRRNFRLNGADGIRLIKGAVVGADHPGDTATMHINPGFWSGSVHPNPRLRSQPTEVPVRRLRQLLRGSGATAIIMDIEGAEREVLRDPLPPHLRLVVVELHPVVYGPEGMDEITRLMLDQGFDAHHNRNYRGVSAFLRMGSADNTGQ
ncbi:FkbM family methyltransferase [Paracoccus sp. M683]|uniref:FkbM family methyltransferase n=1 Tax=Paracoccus sp. M683 TaxID=2594268 RepID=UPI00163DD361|nr:FkbM family methyltransferase [Paracoccus sp. M683]